MPEYIEREALANNLRASYNDLKEIYNGLRYDEERRICSAELNTWMECIIRVKEAHAADVAEVRHGEWEKAINQKHSAKWSSKVACSVCHHQGYDRFNYCPNRGAKMDGKGDKQ